MATVADEMHEPSAAEAAQTGYHYPDASGHFGRYGGRFVPETLMHPLAELTDAYERYLKDPA